VRAVVDHRDMETNPDQALADTWTFGPNRTGRRPRDLNLSPGTAPEQLTWSGTGLAVAGTAASLSATVTPPQGETRFYDFADHPVWVRFDVADSSGSLTTYYAQVSNAGSLGLGSASVTGPTVSPGAYSVRARLVAAPNSDAPNAYVASKDLRTPYAGEPVRGGFMAGYAQLGSESVAFEFAPGSTATGSLVFVEATQVNGRDAYRVIVSTSVTSVESHSHTASSTGVASVYTVDAVTGVRYSDRDQTTNFRVTVAADGSATLDIGFTLSLPPGSAVNRL